MSSEALRAKPAFITGQVQQFRETGKLRDLARAFLLVLRQQRMLELLYGLYCSLFHRATILSQSDEETALISVIKEKTAQLHRSVLSRAQLIERYAAKFKVELLPEDFCCARQESIWEGPEFLIIGEYGEGSRLALVSATACVINQYYQGIRGVRHIHSVEPYTESGAFLVATGDTRKFLDHWTLQNEQIRFVRRLRKRLAGFTAAIEVNGQHYFGTDFSSRPNYITTLDGTKYFFPPKAYKLFVTGFYSFFGRYLASVNSELRVVGGRRTLSVFDAVQRRFIYCEFWEGKDQSGLAPGSGNQRQQRLSQAS